MKDRIPGGFSLSSGSSRASAGFSNRRAEAIIEELHHKQKEYLQIGDLDRLSLSVVMNDLRKRADADDDARALLQRAQDLMEPDLPF